MANGTSRNANADLILKRENGNKQMSEEMAILKKGHGNKIPLKAGKSVHNHSVDTLRSKKGGL